MGEECVTQLETVFFFSLVLQDRKETISTPSVRLDRNRLNALEVAQHLRRNHDPQGLPRTGGHLAARV